MTDQELKELQSVELQILLRIDQVCAEHGIDYFLDSGTMLGAARHGGFIPWDDDVDIAMPRASYEKFLKVGQVALGPRYFLQTRETDPGMLQSFAKVRLNGTEMVEEVGKETGAHQGIWVDVFPFDTIKGEESNIRKKRRQWSILHKMYTVRLTNTPQAGAGALKRAARLALHYALRPFPLDLFIRKLDGLADDVPFEQGTRLVCFHYFAVFVPLRHEDVYPLARLSFEGHPLPVPRNWDRYLELTYGDWRQLPPPEKRKVHSLVSLKLPDE